jgi:hypothetical protein
MLVATADSMFATVFAMQRSSRNPCVGASSAQDLQLTNVPRELRSRAGCPATAAGSAKV